MEFKSKLKELREEKGYTQKEISNILNITPTGYASWEQGISEPNIQNIRILAKLYDVSADYLLGLEDENGIPINSDIIIQGDKGTTKIEVKAKTQKPPKIQTLKVASRGGKTIDMEISLEQIQFLEQFIKDYKNKQDK